MTIPDKRNRLADGLLLIVIVAAVHLLLYQASRRLFQKSQHYSADARILVIGNSRVEQGIQKRRVDREAPGGAAFLASQGMDLKIALRLIESHLADSRSTRIIWLSIDPWQLSEQYGEQGYRGWLPFFDKKPMQGYFREVMKENRREYLFMKAIPLLRFNGVKARLLRTAMGMGGVSANRNIVSQAQIAEVVSGYAGHPLTLGEGKLRDLSAICELAERGGISLNLFFMPVIPELSVPWDIPRFRTKVDSLLRGHHTVRFVDFNDRLREHEFYRDTGHLNSRGSEAFSGMFLDSLNRKD